MNIVESELVCQFYIFIDSVSVSGPAAAAPAGALLSPPHSPAAAPPAGHHGARCTPAATPGPGRERGAAAVLQW